MSMRVPEEFIALLREKIDIADVVSEYVKLKRTGHSLVGLCPFHSEKSPSFYVTPSKGFYHCFGCGAGGTVITFLMEMEQIPFVTAVQRLAERASLPMPIIEGTEQSNEAEQRKMAMYQAVDLATKFYNHILMNHGVGAQGLSYLFNRGVTKQTVVQFNLGFAPDLDQKRTLIDFLTRRGITKETILDAGLGVVTDQGELIDRFRGRVMFPIWDLHGKPVAFGARSLKNEKPKYLNSPDTLLFHKGHMLYGYHKARATIKKSGQVILLEGYMDAIAMHQHGITNVVATLGTALTPEQAGLMRRTAEEVILLYDADAAGFAASRKSIDILRDAGVVARVATLPAGVDPDEYMHDKGSTVFVTEVLNKAMSALFYQLQYLTHQHPDHLTSGRIGYLRDAMEIVAQEESSIERESALQWLSQTYTMALSALRDDLERQIRTHERRTGQSQSTAFKDKRRGIEHGARAAPAPLPAKHDVAAQQLLMYMLMHAEVASQVQEELLGDFSSPMHSALQAYLYAYYADHSMADPELFLSTIDDSDVVRYATGLLQQALMQSIGEIVLDAKLIHDYIQCVIDFRIEQNLSRVAAEMKEAGTRGDYVRMREKEAEFRRLQRSLQGTDTNHEETGL